LLPTFSYFYQSVNCNASLSRETMQRDVTSLPTDWILNFKKMATSAHESMHEIDLKQKCK